MRKLFYLFFYVSTLSVAQAASDYVNGTIANHTSTAEGLMVTSSGKLPDNCAGTPYGWMLIPDKNRTMVATALTAIALGKRVTVYTAPPQSGSAYCTVTQFHPTP